MTVKAKGPTLPISEEIHKMKYRTEGETFLDAMNRISSTLSDNDEHRHALTEILEEQRFMPAGRVQSAIGSVRKSTPYNCFVSGTISDSFDDIMDKAKEAGVTMRLGGGIGYDFSTLRPKGARIASQGSQSSGPVSFMDIFDAICGTVAAAGHRRGAQMGVLRVDHPDIIEFIHAKRNDSRLTRFNISVGITDKFMEAVKADAEFDLVFNGYVYETVTARALWNDIMRSTWDWAEPGVLFIDRINEWNNLWYCEYLAATNPCGEQPLPPYGACLLGSFNLVKYVKGDCIDYVKLFKDIPAVVRAMDNVVDAAIYPLEQQEYEAKSKRRMGLGVTGFANALEKCGFKYGTPAFIHEGSKILELIKEECYRTSAKLAEEKGAFPLYDERYLDSKFIKTLSQDTQDLIRKHGIRNSHLTSIAPTGTISLSADNVSSGIEPVFTHAFSRTIQTFEGPITEHVTDFAFREWGVKGVKAGDVPVEDHVAVLCMAQKHVDSACSKTCNVGDDVTWERFKDVYMQAYDQGAKGCTTFRASGKRYGILNETPEEEEAAPEACSIDLVTGQPTCS
jgi:ribonucleoside-diphosphate reductase alpha chain